MITNYGSVLTFIVLAFFIHIVPNSLLGLIVLFSAGTVVFLFYLRFLVYQFRNGDHYEGAE